MASSSIATRNSRNPRTTRKIKKPKTTHLKKQQESNNTIRETSKPLLVEQHITPNDDASGCSTPKAQRFRIPEIDTCPPAPRKQRVDGNCSLIRRQIAFFAPPDIELLLFFKIGDISA